MNLEKLRENIEREINNYEYPHSGVEVGQPKSGDWIAGQLHQMRAALVTLYWVTVEGTPCAIVADDGKRFLLAYSTQAEENSFYWRSLATDWLTYQCMAMPSDVLWHAEPGQH